MKKKEKKLVMPIYSKNNCEIKLKPLRNSTTIADWLSVSKKENKKKNFQHDSQRYKYRQINNIENNLNNVGRPSLKRDSITTPTTTSNNNHVEESTANATVITYESWNSMAMFQPTKSTKINNATHDSYNFKKMLKRINDESVEKKEKKKKLSLKVDKKSILNNCSVSNVEHSTIRNWLSRNETKYSKYSAQNKLKNMQMKISFSNLETIPSVESDENNNDSILDKIQNNKLLIVPSRSNISKIKEKLFHNLYKSSEREKNGFISVAKNLRMSYLKAAAGKITRGVYQTTFKYGKKKIYLFSISNTPLFI